MAVENAKAAGEGECPTFEEALAGLEQIVRDLEEGQIGLAESLARYEQGVHLLKLCYGLLEGAERKIEVLSGVDAAGKPVVVPFEDESSFEREQTGPPRGRRKRSAAASSTGEPAKAAEQPPAAQPPPSQPRVDVPGSLF